MSAQHLGGEPIEVTSPSQKRRCIEGDRMVALSQKYLALEKNEFLQLVVSARGKCRRKRMKEK